MPREVIRVYIPKEMKPLLEHIVDKFGLSESEIFRIAFINYGSKQGLLSEKIKQY